MWRDRLAHALELVCGATEPALPSMTKEQLLVAVKASPSCENVTSLRVVWIRPPFERESRALYAWLPKA